MKIEAAARLNSRLLDYDEWVAHVHRLTGLTSKEVDSLYDWVMLGVFSNRGSTSAKFVQLFTKLRTALPARLQQIPEKPLYRGITVGASEFYRVERAQSLVLKPRLLSAWTFDKKLAQEYAFKAGYGILLRQDTPTSALLYIGRDLLSYLAFDRINNLHKLRNQEEVVVYRGQSKFSGDAILL